MLFSWFTLGLWSSGFGIDVRLPRRFGAERSVVVDLL
jgi:hypothetical protein